MTVLEHLRYQKSGVWNRQAGGEDAAASAAKATKFQSEFHDVLGFSHESTILEKLLEGREFNLNPVFTKPCADL